jgi:hypothetical protein
MKTKPKVLISITSLLMFASICSPTVSAAEETPPPSIPRPEGVGVIGMIDGNPIYGPISPPASIPRPEGVGVIGMIDGNPIYGPIAGSGTWFPGMKDSSGTEIPPPLFNQDGTPYVEGVSPRPIIPANADSNLALQFSNPEKITDKTLSAKINSEIKAMEVELSKSNNVYVLNFGRDVSAIDSDLYLSAINKKTKKTFKIPVKIDSSGQAVVPTKMDLSKYNVYLKRGKTTLKKVSITN